MLCESSSGRFSIHDHQRNTKKMIYFDNFLDDIASFDHRFFKKFSHETASMNSQQRLLLKIFYQALKSSDFFDSRESNLDVDCFIEVCASDYNDNMINHSSNAFSTLETLRIFVSGRVSHFFELSESLIALDTICSSSAVVINAVCKTILHDDCKSVIVDDVSVFTSSFFYQNLSTVSFLSFTDASKSFDVSADDYCREEGVDLVVLKRLSQAVADDDIVLGTILVTSIRQSSNKMLITVSYSSSQTTLYRKLLNTTDIAVENVTYVEAHDTNTFVDDSLEYEIIKKIFNSKSRRESLHFVSVKRNIEHTEGASEVIDLIKIILMMQNRVILRQANYVSMHLKITLISEQLSISTKTLS